MPKKTSQKQGDSSKNDGSTVVGYVLVGIGCLFLVSNFVPAFDIGKLWPVFPIIIGFSIIYSRK